MKNILLKILLIVAIFAVAELGILFYFFNKNKIQNSLNLVNKNAQLTNNEIRKIDAKRVGFQGEITNIDNEYITLSHNGVSVILKITNNNIPFSQGPKFLQNINENPKVLYLGRFNINKVNIGDTLDVIGNYEKEKYILPDSIMILI